ncbi:MAG TPA: hypothetical protein PLX97_12085, partial [Gemmatales bacterium]|nr:hypothetical protein [Gemmatales bacterium]
MPGCKRRINIFENSALEHSNLDLAFWLAIMWNSVSKNRCSGHKLAELLGCEYWKIRFAIKSVNSVKSQLRKQGAFYRSNKFLEVIRGFMSECCSEH